MAQIFEKYGAEETATVADRMKGQAFRFATIAAVSTGKDDYIEFPEVQKMLDEGDKKAALLADHHAVAPQAQSRAGQVGCSARVPAVWRAAAEAVAGGGNGRSAGRPQQAAAIHTNLVPAWSV